MLKFVLLYAYTVACHQSIPINEEAVQYVKPPYLMLLLYILARALAQLVLSQTFASSALVPGWYGQYGAGN